AGPSRRGYQSVSGVVRLHRVTTEVVRAGERLPEVRDRLRRAWNLRGVGAGGGRVDVHLVAGGLVDAVRRLDAVTAGERCIPADVLHLLARDADVVVVLAADIAGFRACVPETSED